MTTDYTAKEAADGLGITVSTLHYYEQTGLVPKISRDKNNTRRYTEENLRWLGMIVMMRSVGVPIAEIRKYCELLMGGPETAPQRLQVVQAYREKLEQQKQEIENCLGWLAKKEAFYQTNLQQGNSLGSFAEESRAFWSFDGPH